MNNCLELRYESSGKKFFIRPDKIEAIQIHHLCFYGPRLIIVIDGREVTVLNTIEDISRQIYLLSLPRWKRKIYQLLFKVFK